MLGSLLKQLVSGMEAIPEDIARAFQEEKKVIGGRGPQLTDIVKMLQTITSSQRICVHRRFRRMCGGASSQDP